MAASNMGLVTYNPHGGSERFAVYIGDREITSTYLGLIMKGVSITSHPNVKIEITED